MNALLKTLAIVAFLALASQTVRHAYILWLQPRTSVLDKYDRPLRDEITSANSLDELVRRYDPIRKQVDQIRQERAKSKDSSPGIDIDVEPFKSEHALSDAIKEWEDRAKEIRELRFYCIIGLAFFVLGLACYKKLNRWAGVTLVIAAFSEFIYWTSPTFLGGGMREFDRLLEYKLAFSLVSLVLVSFVIWWWQVFASADKKASSASAA